jgi:hypothetical protein
MSEVDRDQRALRDVLGARELGPGLAHYVSG